MTPIAKVNGHTLWLGCPSMARSMYYFKLHTIGGRLSCFDRDSRPLRGIVDVPFCHIEAVLTGEVPPTKVFDALLALDDNLAQMSTLIFCHRGCRRSATLALCYLMW